MNWATRMQEPDIVHTDRLVLCSTKAVLFKLTTDFGAQELYTPAPRLWLRPQRAADIAPPPSYACPLYRTPERRGVLATTGHSTNFIMLIRLPTPLPPVHWTLRGAALLCHRPE